ncbi:MAG: hypothetical protein ACRYFK_09990 [Janthinobacterium lividum]
MSTIQAVGAGNPSRWPATYYSSYPRKTALLHVLALAVADLRNEQIVEHFWLRVRIVESHCRTLLHKAGVRT